MCYFKVHDNDKSDDIVMASPWEQHVTILHDIWPIMDQKPVPCDTKFTPTKVPKCMTTTKPFSQLISQDGLHRN